MDKTLKKAIPLTGKTFKDKRSTALSADEIQALKTLRAEYNNDSAFARHFDIDRVTLIRIVNQGSGSDKNVRKIRRKLKSITQAVA